jgi:hypothetical protein
MENNKAIYEEVLKFWLAYISGVLAVVLETVVFIGIRFLYNKMDNF